MVVLLRLLHGADSGGAERREPVDGVQTLENIHPVRHRLVADLEVLPDAVDGERRAHEIRESEHQQLQVPEVLDPLQARQLLTNQEVAMLAGPAPGLDLRAAEERLREAAKSHEVGKLIGRADPDLCDRERVETEQVVATLERVSSTAVEVESRASGDEDALRGRASVVQALEHVSPGPELVDVVEDPERGN